MNIDVDVLKGIRDFVDWAQKKGNSIVNYFDRNKLNEILNSITDLVANKKLYLHKLNNVIKDDDKEQIELEIKNALSIAQKDTNQLLKKIEEAEFTNSEVYRVLNGKMAVLGKIKLSEIERLKELVGEGEIAKNVAETLSKYEQQWDYIAIELEKIKKTVANNELS